ncbi:hypothetical protein LO762_00230 [Actinocorallia sp. API 0066]|nr:hypothetical protein [Actinocorallia sp. API 0066]MCD0447629.1 hypothetical protein [Actinocorallia sp. API 0066]
MTDRTGQATSPKTTPKHLVKIITLGVAGALLLCGATFAAAVRLVLG